MVFKLYLHNKTRKALSRDPFQLNGPKCSTFTLFHHFYFGPFSIWSTLVHFHLGLLWSISFGSTFILIHFVQYHCSLLLFHFHFGLFWCTFTSVHFVALSLWSTLVDFHFGPFWSTLIHFNFGPLSFWSTFSLVHFDSGPL